MYKQDLISNLFRERERLALFVSFLIPHARFASLFQPSIKLNTDRDTVMIGQLFIIQVYYLPLEVNICFACLFYCLNARFTSLFQSSLNPEPGRYTAMLGLICISQVYYLFRERKNCFACIFFKPTSLLCELILVESKTGPRQRQTNDWPNYQLLLVK